MTIEVWNGGMTITGEHVDLYRLLAMRGAYKLWAKTGRQVTCGVRIQKLVQQTIQSKTRDKARLLTELEAFITMKFGTDFSKNPQ